MYGLLRVNAENVGSCLYAGNRAQGRAGGDGVTDSVHLRTMHSRVRPLLSKQVFSGQVYSRRIGGCGGD